LFEEFKQRTIRGEITMPFWIPLAVGGGLGLVKGLMNKSRENKDRALAAETWRNSPWTGVRPGAVERSNLVGDVAGGLASGALAGAAGTGPVKPGGTPWANMPLFTQDQTQLDMWKKESPELLSAFLGR
jgi:hypothetical protein